LDIIAFHKIEYFRTGTVQKQSLILRSSGAFFLLIFLFSVPSHASSGTEGASFLDIPIGAGPAAMGAAYSALADDAYAPTINPAGLGFLGSTQFAGQHVSYLDSMHYEYLSAVVPYKNASGLGFSAQYFGSGDITGTDTSGNPTGNYSSYYSAYNASYGRSFFDRFSAGVTGKWINAKIADVSANAFAADLGGMYRASDKLTLASVLANVGSKLNFLNQPDSLPLAFHLGAAYRPARPWLVSIEGVYPQTGVASAHFGIEWHPISMLALRTGYRTDTVTQAGALAGFTTGLGLQAFGMEFSYAWVPMGDLGDTHYFSLVLRLGEPAVERRNLIQYNTIKTHRTVQDGEDSSGPEFQQLMELLEHDDAGTKVGQAVTPEKSGDN
jgi:hypothetical protein